MNEDRSADGTDTTSSCCASCGIAEVDEIKLNECDDCDLVRYCSDACRTEHRLQHEEECKKRAAELRDELLFKQPESLHVGDCPICCLPFSLDLHKKTLTSCCFKNVCNGCMYANYLRERKSSLVPSCPFCREALTERNNDAITVTMPHQYHSTYSTYLIDQRVQNLPNSS